MGGFSAIGRLLLGVGLFLALVGLALIGLGKLTWLKWPRLPGDIAIERPGFRFYFPLVTCLVLSAVLTLLVWLFGRRS